MQWVYASGSTSKPRKRVQTVEQETARKAVTSGFFSSLFSSFASPQRPSTPAPPPVQSAEQREQEDRERRREEDEERHKLLSVNETSVTLAVFSAEVEVRLDERMKKELLRATKKNPPTAMKFELIYVRF